MPDELSSDLTAKLIQLLDCTLTLRRGADDRSAEVGVVITTSWDPDTVEDPDRAVLTRHVQGEADEQGWHRARVATLYGHLLDLAAPDVLDQADEISAVTLAIAQGLRRDGDTVLALEDVDWFPRLDSVRLARASLELIERTITRLCDRLAYQLGDHLRLVTTGQPEPPVLEHPLEWWTARGWLHAGGGIVIWPCSEL